MCACARTLRVYNVFTKIVRGPWLEETLPQTCRCDKLYSAIHVVLLSDFASRSIWLQQKDMQRKPSVSGSMSTALKEILSPHGLIPLSWRLECDEFCHFVIIGQD